MQEDNFSFKRKGRGKVTERKGREGKDGLYGIYLYFGCVCMFLYWVFFRLLHEQKNWMVRYGKV